MPARDRSPHPAGIWRAASGVGGALICRSCISRCGTSPPRRIRRWTCCPRCSGWPSAWSKTRPRRNPCRSVRLYRKNRRERLLTPEEYRCLGRVLDEAETDGGFLPSGIAPIRLLLTGCQKNEIVTLRWDDVDRTAGEIRLRDAKTGARRLPLTPAVEWVLAGIPRIEGNMGHHWEAAGRSSEEPRPDLAEAATARRARRCADSRLPTFVCVAGAGNRRGPSDGRQVAGAPQGDDQGMFTIPISPCQ